MTLTMKKRENTTLILFFWTCICLESRKAMTGQTGLHEGELAWQEKDSTFYVRCRVWSDTESHLSRPRRPMCRRKPQSGSEMKHQRCWLGCHSYKRNWSQWFLIFPSHCAYVCIFKQQKWLPFSNEILRETPIQKTVIKRQRRGCGGWKGYRVMWKPQMRVPKTQWSVTPTTIEKLRIMPLSHKVGLRQSLLERDRTRRLKLRATNLGEAVVWEEMWGRNGWLCL